MSKAAPPPTPGADKVNVSSPVTSTTCAIVPVLGSYTTSPAATLLEYPVPAGFNSPVIKSPVPTATDKFTPAPKLVPLLY